MFKHHKINFFNFIIDISKKFRIFAVTLCDADRGVGVI